MRGSMKVFVIWTLAVVAVLFSFSAKSLARYKIGLQPHTCSCDCSKQITNADGSTTWLQGSAVFLTAFGEGCGGYEGTEINCSTAGNVGFTGAITDCSEMETLGQREGAPVTGSVAPQAEQPPANTPTELTTHLLGPVPTDVMSTAP